MTAKANSESTCIAGIESRHWSPNATSVSGFARTISPTVRGTVTMSMYRNDVWNASVIRSRGTPANAGNSTIPATIERFMISNSGRRKPSR